MPPATPPIIPPIKAPKKGRGMNIWPMTAPAVPVASWDPVLKTKFPTPLNLVLVLSTFEFTTVPKDIPKPEITKKNPAVGII